MKTVGAFEAKTHFSQLLDKVEQGETITITRRGAPVAKLSPISDRRSPEDIAAVIESWIEYRDKHDIRLNGLSVREMIEEGRRY